MIDESGSALFRGRAGIAFIPSCVKSIPWIAMNAHAEPRVGFL
jgi:hypothetical protein